VLSSCVKVAIIASTSASALNTSPLPAKELVELLDRRRRRARRFMPPAHPYPYGFDIGGQRYRVESINEVPSCRTATPGGRHVKIVTVRVLLALLVALAVERPAHAEAPVIFLGGAGMALQRTQYHDYYLGPAAAQADGTTSFLPGARIDVAYRVHATAGVGVHIGAHGVRALRMIALDQFARETYLELEAGLSGFVSTNRWSVAPWLGWQGFQEKRQLAGGVTVMYDLRTFEREHIGVFASATYGSGFTLVYAGLCVGVAYGYW
jgi:hypothetical protein